MAREKENVSAQGICALNLRFMAFNRAEASSADWPPDKKAMPGTAAGTARKRHLTVASATRPSWRLNAKFTPPIGQVTGMSCASVTRCEAVASDGSIIGTTDGGATWVRQNSSPGEGEHFAIVCPTAVRVQLDPLLSTLGPGVAERGGSAGTMPT